MANLFSPAELANLKSDVQEIIRDTSVNTLVKYRRHVGTDYYDPKDQIYASPWLDTSGVSAIRGMVKQKEVDRISNIQVGDTKFVFMRSGVSNVLSTADLIVDTEGNAGSGTTYNVKNIDTDPLDVVYIAYARAAN